MNLPFRIPGFESKLFSHNSTLRYYLAAMQTSTSNTLICGPCARSQFLPHSEAFRTGCWTGTGVLKHIITHSFSHPDKPTGSYFDQTGFLAVEERARQFYASDYHYFEEEKPGEFRGWQPYASHSGQLEYSGVSGDRSNTLKFVLLNYANHRHGMIVPFTSLPTWLCAKCGRRLPPTFKTVFPPS